MIQKSELNGVVLEVVGERRKSERGGAEIDGGSGKGDGTLNILKIQLAPTELAGGEPTLADFELNNNVFKSLQSLIPG